MTNESALAQIEPEQAVPPASPPLRNGRKGPLPQHLRFTHYSADSEAPPHQAELFYLQKQIQAQTPMVFVLEDGERIEGIIEWYDRDAIKIRGRARTLLYKSAIRYMHKLGENN